MRDDESDIKAIDFDAEMRLLAGTDMQQLTQQAAGGSAKSKHPVDKSELLLTLGQIVRPLAQEIEYIKKSSSESNQLLVALGKIINSQQATAAAASTPAAQSAALETMAQQMQRLGSVESANQKLFDALHTELKGYKDNFLFEALQKPFIRELLPLFDDLSSLHGQLEKRLEALRARQKEAAEQPPAAPPQPRMTRLIDLSAALLSRNDPPAAGPSAAKFEDSGETDFLKNLAGNVENHVHHVVEILLRMDVSLVQTTRGLPVDKKVHRTVSFEHAAASEDDNTVARSLKPGFSWKERMIRPEDIVAYRWHAPGETPPPPKAPVTVRLPESRPAV